MDDSKNRFLKELSLFFLDDFEKATGFDVSDMRYNVYKSYLDQHDPTRPFQEFWDSVHNKRTKRETPIMITWSFRF